MLVVYCDWALFFAVGEGVRTRVRLPLFFCRGPQFLALGVSVGANQDWKDMARGQGFFYDAGDWGLRFTVGGSGVVQWELIGPMGRRSGELSREDLVEGEVSVRWSGMRMRRDLLRLRLGEQVVWVVLPAEVRRRLERLMARGERRRRKEEERRWQEFAKMFEQLDSVIASSD